MQVAANIAAGQPGLNAPSFNLYTGNLSRLETWTKHRSRHPVDRRPSPECVGWKCA